MNYDKNIKAKEVLKNAMKELEYNSQDLIHVAANYLNENIKRLNNEKNLSIQELDMSKYSSKNFDENKWNDYLLNMVSLGLEKKLEFQTILSAITSEQLVREYKYKLEVGRNDQKLADKIKDPKGIFKHADLAESFAEALSREIVPVTSGNFIIKNVNIGDYLNILSRQINKGTKADNIIKDLLDNFSEYYFL